MLIKKINSNFSLFAASADLFYTQYWFSFVDFLQFANITSRRELRFFFTLKVVGYKTFSSILPLQPYV